MMTNGELEAQLAIQASGNYSDDEVPDIMQAYRALAQHMGWQDRRSDHRFVVKFHDILYCTLHMDTGKLDALFDAFCQDVCDDTIEQINEAFPNVDVEDLLTTQHIGSYRALVLYTPEITEENIVELATRAYDEYPSAPDEYVEAHIYTVDTLQYLEDTYLTRWIEFLRINGYDDVATQTEHNITRKDYKWKN